MIHRKDSLPYLTMAILLLIVLSLLGIKKLVEFHAERQLARLASRVSGFMEISWQDVRFDLLRLDLVLSKIKIGTKYLDNVSIGSFVVDDSYDRIPRDNMLLVHFKDVRIPVDHENFGKFASKMAGFGYSKIDFDIDIGVLFLRDSQVLLIDPLNILSEDSGFLRAKLEMKNLSFKTAENPTMIKKANLSYTDRSLLKKIALFIKKADEPFYGFVTDLVRAEISVADERGDRVKENNFRELLRFLNKPDAFFMKVRLKRPVVLRDLAVVKRLGEIFDMVSFKVLAGG